MRAGEANKKIIIEAKTSTVDSVGDEVETWATYASPFAKISYQNGNEFSQAKALYSELNSILTVRYIDGLDTTMRVNDGGVYLDILAIIEPPYRRKEQKLYCREV